MILHEIIWNDDRYIKMHLPTSAQLKRIIPFKKQIEEAEAKIFEILKDVGAAILPSHTIPKRKKRKMSAAGKARIAAAQKARWAKVRVAKAAPAAEKSVIPKPTKQAKGKAVKKAVKSRTKTRAAKPAFSRAGNG